MAVASQYSDSARADNTQKSDQWQSIGALAARIVGKAGQK